RGTGPAHRLRPHPASRPGHHRARRGIGAARPRHGASPARRLLPDAGRTHRRDDRPPHRHAAPGRPHPRAGAWPDCRAWRTRRTCSRSRLPLLAPARHGGRSPRMNARMTWRYLGRLYGYAPILSTLHMLGWTAFMVTGLVQGLVARELFNRLEAGNDAWAW